MTQVVLCGTERDAQAVQTGQRWQGGREVTLTAYRRTVVSVGDALTISTRQRVPAANATEIDELHATVGAATVNACTVVDVQGDVCYTHQEREDHGLCLYLEDDGTSHAWIVICKDACSRVDSDGAVCRLCDDGPLHGEVRRSVEELLDNLGCARSVERCDREEDASIVRAAAHVAVIIDGATVGDTETICAAAAVSVTDATRIG